MSSQKKKNNKAGPAQQLIDSLLDERTPLRSENGPAALQIDDRPYDAKPLKTTTVQAKPNTVALNPTKSASAPAQSFTSDAALNGNPSDPRMGQQKNVAAKNEPQTVTFGYEDLKGVTPVEANPEQEKTVRLDPRAKKSERSVFEGEPVGTKPVQSTSGETRKPVETSVVDRLTATELKTVVQMRDHSVNRPQKSSSSGAQQNYSSSDAQLKQSESLRFAQLRINELEIELERLRRENENLASAGETLGRRADELVAKTETLEIQAKESTRINDEERKVFRGQIQQKDRENNEMRSRMEEMEGRLESNFKKIRVRERELEHRLEIVRMESSTLVSTKDKMILDLKRQIDQLTHENEYGKQKTQELYNQYKDKQETARRVVRALRIALTILEGEDTSSSGKKGE